MPSVLVVRDVPLANADGVGESRLRDSKPFAEAGYSQHGTIVAALLARVNSAPCCEPNSAADSFAVVSGATDKSKSAKVTPEQKAECARLLAIYKQRATCSQAEFAETNGLGSQSNLGHYLHGRQALNLSAAIKFALGLGVDIADFSERLAAEVEEVAKYLAPRLGAGNVRPMNPRWPFPAIPEASIRSLSRDDALSIQGAILFAAGQLQLDIRKQVGE